MMHLTASEIAGLFWSQCWQLTILIGFVALLGAVLLRHRPHLMHLLWLVVIVKSLTIPLWGSPTGLFSWIQPRATESVAVEGHLTPAPSPSLAVGDFHEGEIAAVSLTQSREVVTRSVVAFALVIWATGVVLLLGLAARSWIDVYRALKRRSHGASRDLENEVRRLLARLSMRSRVRVIISESNLGPMVFGSIRPVLILPAALATTKSPRQLQPILVHELLHVRRGDTTFGALQFVAQVVWWFHPLVWWACRQANRVSERCCDEEVVANLECDPREYAGCLLDALEMRATLNAAPALPGIRASEITSSRLKNIVANAGRFRKTAPWRYWVYAVGLALLLLPGGKLVVNAQGGPRNFAPATESDNLRDKAERASANRDWNAAADAFLALTEQDESDGRAWFMLGYCLHASGKLDEAIVAHKRAAMFPKARSIALYNLACAYALRSKPDAAIETLERAIDSGFISAKSIANDQDFVSLKNDSRFLKLVAAAKPNSDREVYRQFDFWIGRWDVFNREGRQVGSNTITKDEKGFLLTEKWTNDRGDTGTSINYFDPSERRWKQTWVDASGNIVHYRGGFRGGKMSFDGSLTRPNGVVVASRVSYSRNQDGSVRQLIEHSRDEGKSWTTYFDGRHVARSD